jgi:hypothetical protein
MTFLPSWLDPVMQTSDDREHPIHANSRSLAFLLRNAQAATTQGGEEMRAVGEKPNPGEVRRHCVPGTRPKIEETVDRLKVTTGLADPGVHPSARDFTISVSADTVIAALLRRVGGRAAFSVAELARAEQLHLERRGDGHKLELWVVTDT